MKLAVVIALLLGLSSWSVPIAASPPPSIQAQALEIAYEAGVAFEPSDWPAYAHPFPVVVQAILMRESSGCLYLHNPKTKTPIGCMQLHYKTAIKVAGVPISKAMLRLDWTLNIRIGAAYLAYCFGITHKPALAISCYTEGEFHYRWHDPYTAKIIDLMNNLPQDTE